MRRLPWGAMLVMALAGCDPFETTNGSADDGCEAYEAGRYAEATASFQTAREQVPERPELHFDLGTSLLAEEKWSEAEEALARAFEGAGEELKPLVLANLGLARLKLALSLAEGEERTQMLTKALDALERAVVMRPEMESARRNLELALLHLYPPCHKREDSFEPNDAPEQAGDLKEANKATLLLCPGSRDHYKVTVNAGDRLTVQFTRTGTTEPLPLPPISLINPAGAIVANGAGEGEKQGLSHEALAAGDLTLKLEEQSDEEHHYALETTVLPACGSLQESQEPNNSREQAVAVDPAALAAQAEAQGQASGAPPGAPAGVPFRICPGDQDWFRVKLEEHESLMAQVTYEPVEGDLELAIADSRGKELATGRPLGKSGAAQGDEKSSSLSALLLDLPAGDYLVRISGHVPRDEAGGTLSLMITPPCPEGDDQLEENDSRTGAHHFDLAPPAQGQEPGQPPAEPPPPQPVEQLLRRCPGDDDWFSVDLTAQQQVSIEIAFDHAKGDLRLEAFREDGPEPIATSDSSGEQQAGEAVRVLAEEPGKFLLRVTGGERTANFYHLRIAPPQPDSNKGDSDQKKDEEQEQKEEQKPEEQEQRQQQPIDQMMDQLDRQKQPNLEAEKAVRQMPNAQAPGGRVW